MLIQPRIHKGQTGYQVVAPLERAEGTKVLVNRGWIAKEKRLCRGLPGGCHGGGVAEESVETEYVCAGQRAGERGVLFLGCGGDGGVDWRSSGLDRGDGGAAFCGCDEEY